MNKNGTLAIIPARGGSKRLPRKNILPMAGKPMIAWTIEAALQSSKVERVVVSTDDIEIAEVSRFYGAEVPYLRNSELASDQTTTVEVVLDVLRRLPDYEKIVLLQPTSPLRKAQHIDNAEAVFEARTARAVISVCETEHPFEWTNHIGENGSMDSFMPSEVRNKRSQDFVPRYRINGAIYIIKKKILEMERTFFPSHGVYAYLMDRNDSIDIDERLDFQVADLLLRQKMEGENAPG
jgi:CMP-N,N'-diacetyllegionaminic acid synthase